MAAFAGLMGFSVSRREPPIITPSGDELLTPDSFLTASGAESSRSSSTVDSSAPRPWPKREREESSGDALLFSESRGGWEGRGRSSRGRGGYQQRGETFRGGSHRGRGRGGGSGGGGGEGGALVVRPSMFANPWAELEKKHGLPSAVIVRSPPVITESRTSETKDTISTAKEDL